MRRARRRRIVRGTLAGIAGGLAASWVMNLFISGVGEKLTESLMSDEDRIRQQAKQEEQQQNGRVEEDATMKVAEDVAHTVSGGQHLSHEERKKAGPVVHYVFGGLLEGSMGRLRSALPGQVWGLGQCSGQCSLRPPICPRCRRSGMDRRLRSSR